jgi:predicted PurR-regulated permease PerM
VWRSSWSESYLITPLIQKRMVSLPPALTIVFQLLAGVLAGGLGLLLAAPLTVVGLVLVRRLYLDRILGEREDPMGPS